MTNIKPIILSGGSGTRLWPLSREQYPKQLLPLLGPRSMLQETLARLNGIDIERVLIICNDAHRFLVAEQTREMALDHDIVLEPVGRNTAPAIAIAALTQSDPESVLLVLPADHVIDDEVAFQRLVRSGAELASKNFMVTFGVVPSSAETGYGYIQSGEKIGDGFAVESFVEKPDKATAESYLAAGNYFWNSGMFMFKAGRYLEELDKFEPEMLAYCQRAYKAALTDLDFIRVDPESFGLCPSQSIDYAVMEKTDAAVVLPADIGWNDVGSWSSLWDVSEKDSEGNRSHGDVILESSSSNYVYTDDKLVALLGIENTIVVNTPDALLIANKNQVQEVKLIVDRLKREKRPETDNHRKVYRPWGNYDSVDVGEGFQVKRITVNPKQSISLQRHKQRAEHWIVVDGVAEVTCGEKVFLVQKNESTFIPLGEKHRLRNPGVRPLRLIEVQSGDYLGEDDIERFEDNYGRE